MGHTCRRWSIVVAAGVLAACSGGGRDQGGATSTTTTSPAAIPRVEVDAPDVAPDPQFSIGRRSGAYAVVYLVEDLARPGAPQSTERVLVRPPFDSRLDSLDGTPPGEVLVSTQLATFDRLRLGAPDAPLVVYRVPGLAPSDVRVAPILEQAMTQGRLELLGQRRIAGRRCQVVRSATLLGAGPLRPIGPDESAESAESCIDGDGILLEETLVLDGVASFRRVATEVDLDPTVADGDLQAGPVTAPVDQGGGSVLPVEPTAGALGPFWELPDDEIPDGFVLLGRFGVVPPQPENFGDESRAANVVAGTADVFVRGVDALVIYQGGTRGGVPAFRTDPDATPVDGGALGPGVELLSATGTELRFPQADGHFVHVIGSLGPDALGAVARALVETEGTGLVYR